MSLYQHKLQVLAILSDNLRTPQPQLVPTASIAREMDIQFSKLHQILKAMDSMGIIQTDSELQYNLITRKGLNYLGEQ
ncbi:MAG: DNA-binding IclR family transcriptional regulator [Desulforhopalus sp.]|jgi:DNA-binding IclR family transcriptional regulator